MKKIHQKSWASTKEIVIQPDSLLVRTRNIREDLEYIIKFEDLGFDIVRKRIKSANIPFFVFLVFDVFYIGLLIAAVITKSDMREQLFWLGALIFFTIMTVAAYYNRNKNVIYLTGGKKILELLADKPDNGSVSQFVERIHEVMRLHYKHKYTAFEPDTPYEVRLGRLKWLKEIKALSAAEYEELVALSRTQNIIGFGG